MSKVRGRGRSGGAANGGIIGYPLERVYREVAFLGTRVHWTLDELMNFDHAERQKWIVELMRMENADERPI